MRLWVQVHTWTSLISMVFLLMLCLTGLPLIFHQEIDHYLEDEISAPEMPSGTPLLPLDRLIASAQQRLPEQHVLFVAPKEAESIAVVTMSPTAIPVPGQFHRLTVDARTGAVLGEEGPHQDVMDVILRIHRDMFTGLPGELFLGLMGLVFAASIISGVVIYWPFMKRLQFGTVRNRSARLRWLDLHNLLGIVTVSWALAVGLTGTINTLAVPLFDLWRAQTMPALLAAYQGKPLAEAKSVGGAVDAVRAAFPDRLVAFVTMPTTARFGSPQHLIVWTKGGTPFTARMFQPVLVDANDSAKMVAPGVSWYLRALQVSRPLHFGDYGGLPLKIIWALLDVITIIVLSSGLYLWVAKRWGSKRRLATSAAATVAPVTVSP
ncbi:membrane protein [Bradyrhizobium sp. SSBR45G]|uniref:PepSY-associated TM helix domain-containing protein n=1 Tax=unclassified Bradyrhizobium TaxID=2631580 RepID=UPI0023429BD0|nr:MULTISPECIES: PepSY-associated TM helix domain-containing protein [unclassified Bradyrhizobium]GLH79071.1 membrane protein [Bradyrhizobium sp. SSBR45G]GLH86606.1 membrane protein [Bradyrhizobium sp. SSBR45R]